MRQTRPKSVQVSFFFLYLNFAGMEMYGVVLMSKFCHCEATLKSKWSTEGQVNLKFIKANVRDKRQSREMTLLVQTIYFNFSLVKSISVDPSQEAHNGAFTTV